MHLATHTAFASGYFFPPPICASQFKHTVVPQGYGPVNVVFPGKPPHMLVAASEVSSATRFAFPSPCASAMAACTVEMYVPGTRSDCCAQVSAGVAGTVGISHMTALDWGSGPGSKARLRPGQSSASASNPQLGSA